MKLSTQNNKAKEISNLAFRLCEHLKLVGYNHNKILVELTKDELQSIIWASLLVEDANYLYKIEKRENLENCKES